MNFNKPLQSHITVNDDCVITSRVQKVRRQGHTRSKLLRWTVSWCRWLVGHIRELFLNVASAIDTNER